MPSEAPTCPTCGSTDVQEVKPGTYFCNYSETVFKYIDPSRLRVEHSPAFCWCGNPIQVQCQLCKTEMCLQCDVAADPTAIYRAPGTRFGYGPNRDTMHLLGQGLRRTPSTIIHTPKRARRMSFLSLSAVSATCTGTGAEGFAGLFYTSLRCSQPWPWCRDSITRGARFLRNISASPA